jgi:4-amino-4-deoxy-L-arabinose transferase-like glycosyltransferase
VTRALARHPFVASYVLALAPRLALAAVSVGVAGDTATYKAAAAALRSSPLTGDETFLRVPPLFPAYLAVIPNDTLALVIQIAIVSLIAPVLGIATARHFGRTAGIVAAVIAALEASLIVWSTYLLTDSFGALFFAIALERTSKALESGSLRSAFGAGLGLGLALLTRAAFIVAAGLIVLLSAFAPDRRVTRGVIVALGILVVLAIPTTRNQIANGEPTVFRNSAWQQVWFGTMWNETGRGTIGVDLVLPQGYATWSVQEKETFARETTLRFVAESPSRFALLTMKKLLWLWLPVYPEWSLVHKLWSGGYFLALYALAIIGLARMRRSTFAWLLVASVVALVIPVALTIVDYDGRYRLPVEVCLVPLAAAGLEILLRRLRERRWIATRRAGSVWGL